MSLVKLNYTFHLLLVANRSFGWTQDIFIFRVFHSQIETLLKLVNLDNRNGIHVFCSFPLISCFRTVDRAVSCSMSLVTSFYRPLKPINARIYSFLPRNFLNAIRRRRPLFSSTSYSRELNGRSLTFSGYKMRMKGDSSSDEFFFGLSEFLLFKTIPTPYTLVIKLTEI